MRTTVAMQPASRAVAPWRPAASAAPRVDRRCAACSDEDQREIQRATTTGAAAGSGHQLGLIAVLPPAAAPSEALSVSEPSDPGEQEAERVATRVMAALSSGAPPEAGLGLSAVTRPRLQRAADGEAAAPAPAPEGGFLVEDDAAATMPGQMRKSDFLRELRPAVCTAADRELARAGRSTAGCPYLDRWFAYYEGRGAQHVERSLRRYAPATAAATSAAGYLPYVSERVAQGVRRWVETGAVPDLPEGVPADMPGGGGILGALGGLASGVAQIASRVASGIGSAVSAIGSLFFKAGEGGAVRGVDPNALRAQLGEGRPLDGGSRSRMGSAFGYDFGAVRVHDDAPAAALAERLHARAFTLGTHVAFGAGQHRPGQPLGDALLAHELAHVVQQGGASPGMPGQAPAEHDAVEQEADASAVAATLSLWAPEQAPAHARRERARPRLRSGLQLRRCAAQQRPPLSTAAAAAAAPLPQAGTAPCSAADRQRMDVTSLEQIFCCTPAMLSQISGLRLQAIPLVDNAISRLRSPDSVRDALWAHFRIRPDDAEGLRTVRDQLAGMLATMQGDDVRFICADAGDPVCATSRAATSPTCQSGTKYIRLCGDYAFSVAPGSTTPYLDTSPWLTTIIHEYAHAGCRSSGGILPAGSESYLGRGTIPYPPDGGRAIHNADSYANFVIAVG